MGENTCKSIPDKGLISRIYRELLKLNKKKPSSKMGRRSKRTFFQRRHTDGQQAHEKMLNIANHQGNANQNHNEISPYTCQNGYHQKEHK